MAGLVNVMNLKTKLDKALYEKNAFNDILAKVEAKTKIRRIYLVIGNILKL